MSIDRSIYVGPIARCRFPTEDREFVVERRCGNCRWNAISNEKFCPACGREVVPKMETRKVCAIDPLSDLDRGFKLLSVRPEYGKFPAGEHVYVTNTTPKDQPRLFHLDEEYEFFWPLVFADIEHDIVWFGATYRSSLEQLATLYGKDNMKIEWAILRWSS